MNTVTILDLITARKATTTAACNDLREQIAKLSNELAALDAELTDLQITRQTLTRPSPARPTSRSIPCSTPAARACERKTSA